MKGVLASRQNSHPFPINKFRQTDGTLRLSSSRLHHLRRENHSLQHRRGHRLLPSCRGGIAGAAEVAADDGVEGEGGQEGGEEDDEDHGKVGIEISSVSVGEPRVGGGSVTQGERGEDD